MENTVGFIGRRHETEQAIAALGRGRNVLVKGRGGIGKSSFLRQLFERQPGSAGSAGSDPPAFWVGVGSPKPVIDELARQVHNTVGLPMPAALLGPRLLARAEREGGLPWSSLARTVKRMPVSQVGEIITAAMRKCRCLVFLETLEVPPSLADLFAELLEVAQVAACMDDKNRRIRIERLVWRFHETVELKPLALEECEYLTTLWLAEHPVRFSDHKTRVRFIRHVAQDSGGVPAAIRGMLEAARSEEEITPSKARSYQHIAGVRYLDMTPLLVVLLVAMMALRYISRGASMQEMMMMSGVAMALLMGLRFFIQLLR